MAEPRVLVITPDFPPRRGGIQVLVHRIVSGLSEFAPQVVALGDPRGPEPIADLAVRRVGEVRLARALTVLGLNRAAIAEAIRTRPQVVLSAHIVVSPAAALIARALRIPSVQYFYAKEIGAKPGLARFAARSATASVAISRYTRDLILGVGGDGQRIRLIPAGVDLPAAGAPAPAPEGAGDDRPTILTVARLEDRYKGHDVILRAMPLVRARVPRARWVVIGEGPLRPSLERRALEMGLAGDVHFLGAASDEVRDGWLQAARAFAMPSRLPAGGFAGEGFGIVYLEAGAHGLPVVAGNVGGALDAVLDGRTGLLVDPTDHLAVADALTVLLTDPARAAELGRAGRRYAESLAWPRVAARVEGLLREVTSG
jgi:phosphatidyl-myo-inositol dimannoside synthase